MIRSVFGIALYVLATTQLMASEIYKWQDEHGNTHYGDKPVNQPKSSQLEVDTSKKGHITPNAERADMRRNLINAMEEDRLRKEETEAKQRKAKQQRERQCAWARDRLAQYSRAGYLYDLDKEGNRVILSQDERNKVTTGLKDDIQKHCR